MQLKAGYFCDVDLYRCLGDEIAGSRFAGFNFIGAGSKKKNAESAFIVGSDGLDGPGGLVESANQDTWQRRAGGIDS
jgi:hypothetical protein